ncbi:MAG: cytidine deaminase [Clostridiales bacterium]|nr:cytidine deaminase [Clostridiales bacterium]MCF8021440.1 cytidine deaminase [Clostridiales bacterium]
MDIVELIKYAEEASKKAYAPYSLFKVGAALLTSRDNIYAGCNVENTSYGLTICAERVAIFKAVSEGEQEFKALAVFSDSIDYCFPCGACRQVLIEFGSDMQVYMAGRSGKYKVMNISELMPCVFMRKEEI